MRVNPRSIILAAQHHLEYRRQQRALRDQSARIDALEASMAELKQRKGRR